MGTTARTTDHQDPAARVVEWMKANKRLLIIVGTVIFLVASSVLFVRAARIRKETLAERELQQARVSVDAGNLPLAANDLSRIVSTYGNTPAAEEAELLLARVRLLQGQPDLAIAGLRSLIEAGPRQHFLGPANWLLGAAYEDAGRFTEAAKAYEAAVEATPYNHLKAQWLLDVGRSYAIAGDTSLALQAYQTIIDDHSDAPSAIEARVRIAELGGAAING